MSKIDLNADGLIRGEALVTTREHVFQGSGILAVRAFDDRTGCYHNTYCLVTHGYADDGKVAECLDRGAKADDVLRTVQAAVK